MRLYEQGDAYYCDCTREEIDARNRGTGRQGYDGHCRDLGPGAGRGSGAAVPCARARPDRGGRPHPRDADVRPRRHRGLRRPAGQRVAHVPPGQRGRRHDHGGHPRGAGRGAPVEHAEAAAPLGRPRSARAAGVGPCPGAGEREAPEAVEAAGQGGAGAVPGGGVPRRGHAQLPHDARLVAERRQRDRAVGADRGRVPPGGRGARRRPSST